MFNLLLGAAITLVSVVAGYGMGKKA